MHTDLRAAANLDAQRCKIYLYDAHDRTGIGPLPASKVPRSWSDHHRYATEAWIHRNLRTHPWRVRTIAEADVVFVAATFARSCHSGKAFYGRRLWQAILRDPTLWPVAGGRGIGAMSKQRERELRADTSDWGPPKAISLQYPACPPWVDNNLTAYTPRDAILLTEFVPNKKGSSGIASRGLVTPFVVASPPWLAGAPGAIRPIGFAKPPPWRERRLVFFVGHIPKLHFAPARFEVWRQLRNDPRATTKSHSGNCTVGSYATCHQHSDAWLRAQVAARRNDYFISRCHDYCGGEKARASGLSCGASIHKTPSENLLAMQRTCRHYAGVDLGKAVLSDLDRDARLRWSEAEYLEKAMGHQFCLVVQAEGLSNTKYMRLCTP